MDTLTYILILNTMKHFQTHSTIKSRQTVRKAIVLSSFAALLFTAYTPKASAVQYTLFPALNDPCYRAWATPLWITGGLDKTVFSPNETATFNFHASSDDNPCANSVMFSVTMPGGQKKSARFSVTEDDLRFGMYYPGNVASPAPASPGNYLASTGAEATGYQSQNGLTISFDVTSSAPSTPTVQLFFSLRDSVKTFFTEKFLGKAFAGVE